MKPLKDFINESTINEAVFKLPKKSEVDAANMCTLLDPSILIPGDWNDDFKKYIESKYKKIRNPKQAESVYPRICVLGVNMYGTPDPQAGIIFSIANGSSSTPEESTVVELDGTRGTLSYYVDMNKLVNKGDAYEVPEKDYDQIFSLFAVIPDLKRML